MKDMEEMFDNLNKYEDVNSDFNDDDDDYETCK